MGRDLRPLFEPRGVVVTGVSSHPGKFGFVTLHNLLRFGYEVLACRRNRGEGEVCKPWARRFTATWPTRIAFAIDKQVDRAQSLGLTKQQLHAQRHLLAVKVPVDMHSQLPRVGLAAICILDSQRSLALQLDGHTSWHPGGFQFARCLR